MPDAPAYVPINPGGVAQARADGACIPSGAIDAWPIWLVSPGGTKARARLLGHCWIIPDPADPRSAAMLTGLVPDAIGDAQALARAAEVERYSAALLIGSGRFDQVRLVRLNETQSKTAEARQADQRLAAILAEIRARGRGRPA